jgi:hypothetical protein
VSLKRSNARTRPRTSSTRSLTAVRAKTPGVPTSKNKGIWEGLLIRQILQLAGTPRVAGRTSLNRFPRHDPHTQSIQAARLLTVVPIGREISVVRR